MALWVDLRYKTYYFCLVLKKKKKRTKSKSEQSLAFLFVRSLYLLLYHKSTRRHLKMDMIL